MARWAGLISRAVAAVVLAAGAYAAAPAAPAAAAGCPTAAGVTVVVDFNELGSGVRSVCLPDGGGDRASALFPAAGFPLSYVQRQPGFVCQVSGEPADTPCVNTPPADAYWALYWSDGRSGSWTYSTASASGLTVPEGGYAGFSWVGSDGAGPPSLSPARHPEPTPTQQPSAQPTKQPSSQPTQQQSAPPAGGSASAGPSDEPSAPDRTGEPGKPGEPGTPGTGKRSRSASASPTPRGSEAASPSEAATDDPVVPASAEPPDAGDGGLPAWVAPVVIVLLFGAAGAVTVVRRRRAGAV
jgi:hypothetical protein